jgi:alkyl sulfatase BDS1-like metallo-beta-lactamase superfamily hydrolase
LVRSLPLETYLDYLAVRLNHPVAAQGDPITLNFVMPDVGAEFVATVTNGVLNYSLDRQSDEADATVTLDRSTLDDINLGLVTADAAVAQGDVTIDGDADALGRFVSLLDTFDFWFEIVAP